MIGGISKKEVEFISELEFNKKYFFTRKDIRKYLRKHRQRTCDCIISGLPWAAFSQKAQEELLGAVYSSLEYGGEFLTFVYIHGLLLPAGKKFRRLLKERFSSVKKTRIIWGNLPPAFVYHCKK